MITSHALAHTRIHAHTLARAHTHTHTRTCAHTHSHARTHTLARAHTHSHAHSRTHISSSIANLTASWYFIKIKYSEPNISAASSVSPLAFTVLLLVVIKQRCIAAGAPFWIGGELPVFVVRHHAPNRDACTVTFGTNTCTVPRARKIASPTSRGYCFSSRATKMYHRPARRATLNTVLPRNVLSKLRARGRPLLQPRPRRRNNVTLARKNELGKPFV